MEIKNSGYNVAEVTIDTVVTAGTKTEIGTKADFEKIAALADAGGLMRVHIKLGDDQLDGLVLASHVGQYIDLGSVTNFGMSPSVIAGTAELDTGKLYLTINMYPITAGRTATKSASK